ncbi:MerR family transcriptional regulator, redox-sensitive transcriptional activator SoxR [Micromonospora viridifaciens]|uniref:MerR family transcriptional regulator, redox-sensitive transcriptional activator SoxR n=1 Tax=Micromonospora viridifaciens TaxID=1881 RepID=A0A1C4UXR2_MICVI|nr:MerR family transcriptional regulator [Micromonospora viridifaciens]SCE76510.1 MerR family transcriptional regulator, redox-sensitive transcriptional activator SoxR [Micromonospora viridifaciens]
MGTLTVSEVARESGVSGSAIRFYERQGLIEATRTSGNQRRFGSEAACRVRVARVAQRIGLSVGEIRELLAALPPEPDPLDWQVLHDRLTAEAERRIRELHAALDDIRSGRRLCDL